MQIRNKILAVTILLVSVVLLSACTTTVTCGEGTIIKDGKCVAPDVVNNPSDNEEPSDNNDVICSVLEGEIFYEAKFDELKNKLVDNETGNAHTADNFVIWGQTDNGTVLSSSSVNNGTLVLQNLVGTQLDNYYETGLGYQFFNFETDVTYTVCVEVEGPSGQTVTSELGIYYGYGTKDELLLTGSKQIIIQDFMPTLSTNDNYGQYVLFAGNVTGELRVHSIKIVANEK